MRVIVSHDVDNLTRKEHSKDLIVVKMVIRAFIELFLFRINLKTFYFRMKLIITNNFNNIDSLSDLDQKYNTKATYFFATSNDNTLAYKAEDTIDLIKTIKSKNLNVGIHGIAYDDLNEMKKEYNKYINLHNIKSIGIRMHYLRKSENTLKFMKEIGYIYDTTEYSYDFKQPYVSEEGIVEIPTHLMDSYLFQEKGFQKYDSEYIIEKTKKMIDENINKDIILNINFHQEYFSEGWNDWKTWYEWCVMYCNEKKINFASYEEVTNEFRIN